jgi:hypothetical protein
MKNKYILLTSLLVFQLTVAYSQWSTDPENPGIVCDYAGFQSKPQAFADDDGGVFVFWLDNRLNKSNASQVYGQHYDANGYALWEEDGRLIIEHPEMISWFNASRIYNGEIIIGWVTLTDSLRIQRLDEDGSKIWANELIVANASSTPNYILGIYGYHIIHDNSGYCISIGTVYFGGSSGNRITRFTSDGVLTGWYDGEPEGTQYNYGSSGLQSAYDAADNIYIYYSSANGAGAELMCLKVNTAGDTIWGPVNVLAGTSGLAYQFSGISDANGITFVWQGNGNVGSATNLYSRRLNTDGDYAWSGPTIPICAIDGLQENFFWKKSGDNYYITWADSRPGTIPGNYDIYVQKFDINGTVYWTENGVPVISLNTYIPYPKFNFLEDNSMIVCHQSNTVGFVAQKVLDDGTVDWDEDGSLICTSIYNPFYDEHVEVHSGNKVISVWAKSNPGGGSDNIYISRIDNTETNGVGELNAKQIQIYPNPASTEVTVVLPETMNNAEVSLIDFSGKEIHRNIFLPNTLDNILLISTINLASGLYLIRIKSENEIISQKLIVK